MKLIDKIRAKHALISDAQELDEKAEKHGGSVQHPTFRRRAFQKRQSARRIDKEY